MKRRLAGFLTCALIAFGQRSQTPPSESPPTIRFVDAVALDARGQPVRDLSAADFELTQSGQPRKITQVTWFDTRLHTAREGALPADGATVSLQLVPDEIRRNFVVIVDDLGLSAAGIDRVQASLRAFIKDQMESGARMAVLRTSSGTGELQQLTSDHRILTGAIDHIQFLGGGVAENSAAGACWVTLRWALEGLRNVRGRKFVVVFSELLDALGARDPASKDLASDANASMTSVYAVDPRGPVPADPALKSTPRLAALARDTGGVFGAELSSVFRAEEGFYAIGFETPAEDSVVRAKDAIEPATLKVRREGVTIRARSGYLRVAAAEDFAAPAERSLQVVRALASPFEGADIRTHLTATFTTFVGTAADVEVGVMINAGDLAVLRDLNNASRGSLRLIVEARSDESAGTPPMERGYDFALPAAAYQQALRNGMLYAVSLRIPAPGAWQIRTVVADGISDRLGSSVQCIEIPARNKFTVSGLKLQGYDPSGGKGAAMDSRENSAVRIFKAGRTLEFLYSVFDPKADDQKQAHIEVRTRLYGHGQVVFTGTPAPVNYPIEPDTRRQVSGRLTLSDSSPPGNYILEVTVTDTLAPVGSPRTVSRFVDFQLID